MRIVDMMASLIEQWKRFCGHKTMLANGAGTQHHFRFDQHRLPIEFNQALPETHFIDYTFDATYCSRRFFLHNKFSLHPILELEQAAVAASTATLCVRQKNVLPRKVGRNFNTKNKSKYISVGEKRDKTALGSPSLRCALLCLAPYVHSPELLYFSFFRNKWTKSENKLCLNAESNKREPANVSEKKIEKMQSNSGSISSSLVVALSRKSKSIECGWTFLFAKYLTSNEWVK